MEVREGQQWRDVRGPSTTAQIVSVESVEASAVQGSYRQEDAPGVVGAGAWSVDDFQHMTLIHDPEWPTHRVVMNAQYELPPGGPVDQAMMLVGQKGGARAQELVKEGIGPPVAWWDVVAPTEAEAIARAREAVAPLAPEHVSLDSIRVDNSIGHER